MRIPHIYKFIIKFITPAFLIFIIGMWLWQEWIGIIMMKGVSNADKPYIMATRIGLILLFTAIAILVKIAWRRKRNQGDDS